MPAVTVQHSESYTTVMFYICTIWKATGSKLGQATAYSD